MSPAGFKMNPVKRLSVCNRWLHTVHLDLGHLAESLSDSSMSWPAEVAEWSAKANRQTAIILTS